MRPTHLREDGSLTMVDVAAKPLSQRWAHACARVRMSEETEAALRAATLPKGDAFVAAQLAGIMAAKQTSQLIPLTHPIALDHVDVAFRWVAPGTLQIDATAKTTAQTGVEMEALTAAAIAALTIYDMTKALERGITIESLRLVEKRGGKRGSWSAP
ncbi:MAG: cyclic pyranopterin monophosphate synthase MoaC [Candidatus Eremiobacteraeota bacterium]|nr:cyclic pyranopterin monophosphate synthase MoaC [Candidatus Eremiobacteraeota bacterium]MBV9647616.1 cyclic pyranopterin monophosphate synthase MoaC [Candidatus Eremiobacteraeota bacterium]